MSTIEAMQAAYLAGDVASVRALSERWFGIAAPSLETDDSDPASERTMHASDSEGVTRG